MSCKHSIEMLIGTHDGIQCKACGRIFSSMEEIQADRDPVVSASVKRRQAEQKKTRKRKEA